MYRHTHYMTYNITCCITVSRTRTGNFTCVGIYYVHVRRAVSDEDGAVKIMIIMS